MIFHFCRTYNLNETSLFFQYIAGASHGHASWRLNLLMYQLFAQQLVKWQMKYQNDKEISKFALLAPCDGNPSVTGGFTSRRDNISESSTISWPHYVYLLYNCLYPPPIWCQYKQDARFDSSLCNSPSLRHPSVQRISNLLSACLDSQQLKHNINLKMVVQRQTIEVDTTIVHSRPGHAFECNGFPLLNNTNS